MRRLLQLLQRKGIRRLQQSIASRASRRQQGGTGGEFQPMAGAGARGKRWERRDSGSNRRNTAMLAGGALKSAGTDTASGCSKWRQQQRLLRCSVPVHLRVRRRLLSCTTGKALQHR